MRWRKSRVEQTGKLAELKAAFNALREELRSEAARLREQAAALRKAREEPPRAE